MEKLLALLSSYVKDEVDNIGDYRKLFAELGIVNKHIEKSFIDVAECFRDYWRHTHVDGIQIEYQLVQVVEREKTSDERFILLTTHSIQTAVAELKAERARGHRVFIELKHS